MLKVALCCILFVSFWTLLHGVQLPKVSKLKRELSDQQTKFEEELAQQHKRLMNMKHGLGSKKRREVLEKSCSDIKQHNESAHNGVYELLNGGRQVKTWCDLTTDDKGWIVFQRRTSASTSFNINWIDYKNGFGDMSGNFWWGNDNLAAFTSQGSYLLRIDMQLATGGRYHAEYQNFRIEDEDAKYRLHLGTFSGNIFDRMKYHNEMQFSTPDQDNDGSSYHCAQEYDSGWWFMSRYCFWVNLNGLHGGKGTLGIYWYAKTFTWTEMKFRPM